MDYVIRLYLTRQAQFPEASLGTHRASSTPLAALWIRWGSPRSFQSCGQWAAVYLLRKQGSCSMRAYKNYKGAGDVAQGTMKKHLPTVRSWVQGPGYNPSSKYLSSSPSSLLLLLYIDLVTNRHSCYNFKRKNEFATV